MPLRPCLDCNTLVPNASRCPTCQAGRQRQRDARRGSSTQRGYDGAWQRLVAQAIEQHPWCIDCGIDRPTAKAVGNPLTGDHLRWPALSLEDVEVVCRRCNSARGPRR